MKKLFIALSIGLSIVLYSCGDSSEKYGEQSAKQENTGPSAGYNTDKHHGPSITPRTDSSDEGMVHGSGSVPADKEK